MPTFTPTQARIIKMLADGMPHTRKELKTCLDDELAELGAVNFHVSILRKKLRPIGQDIVCELGAGYRLGFRHIRLLASSNDGKHG